MAAKIPSARFEMIQALFMKAINQSQMPLVVLSYGAYIEALVDEIIDEMCPSIGGLNHSTKLRALRDLPLIDEVACQAALAYARIRNFYAHTFQEVTLTDDRVAADWRTFSGIMTKRFGVDRLAGKIREKVEAVALQRVGMKGVRHSGFAGEDGERLKCAAYFLCVYFLIVRYSLPKKGTAIDLSSSHQFEIA